MKMKIRTSAFAAAVLFAVSAVQEAAIYCFAEENTEMSGSCGENVDWAFDADTGVLTISGTGAILDPSYSEIPWYAYRDAVTSVVVEDGITEIGDYAFSQCTNLSEVRLSEQLVALGLRAFSACKNLKEIIIPESVEYIDDSAFSFSYSLENIIFSGLPSHIGKEVFEETLYLKNIEPTDGMTITPEGILLSVESEAENIAVPSSVRMIAAYAFSKLDCTTVEIGGDCIISDKAFFGCKNLKSITVNGYAEKKDRVAFSCGKLTDFNYIRKPLTYAYADSSDAEFHIAESRSVYSEDVDVTTYSEWTPFNNGFMQTDRLQEIRDSKGNIYAVCGSEDFVLVIPEDSGQEILRIEMTGFTFGAAAIDDSDMLYIMWGYSIPDSVIEEEMDTENLVVVKYDLSGNAIGQCGLAVSETKAQFPFKAGNANLVWKDGILGCLYDTEWLAGSDGVHHQGSEFAAIDTDTMNLQELNIWQGSHSLGVSMIPTDYGFAAIQMGDRTARGINMNTYEAGKDRISTYYFDINGCSVVYNGNGNYRDNRNITYTHMGGIAKSRTIYAIAGRSEQLFTFSEYIGSAADTDVFDVFVRLIDSSFCSASDLAGSDRINESDGDIADRNVVWLTECTAAEKAGNVKITVLKDGSYCVMWEWFVDGSFDSIRYVILDECGNIIRSETEIAGARLSDTSVQPIVQGDVLTWATADSEDGSVTWYSVDLMQYVDVCCGDVDMDGNVDISDATLALTIYARRAASLTVDEYTEKQLMVADADQDDDIDISDATAILAYYAQNAAGLNPAWDKIFI